MKPEPKHQAECKASNGTDSNGLRNTEEKHNIRFVAALQKDPDRESTSTSRSAVFTASLDREHSCRAQLNSVWQAEHALGDDVEINLRRATPSIELPFERSQRPAVWKTRDET
jgi:hypothetical protein